MLEFFVLLRIEPSTSYIGGRHSATELHPQLLWKEFVVIFSFKSFFTEVFKLVVTASVNKQAKGQL